MAISLPTFLVICIVLFCTEIELLKILSIGYVSKAVCTYRIRSLKQNLEGWEPAEVVSVDDCKKRRVNFHLWKQNIGLSRLTKLHFCVQHNTRLMWV